MNNLEYITSIVLFTMALFNIVKTAKELHASFSLFNQLRKDPDKKEVQINIPFILYYRVFRDLVLIGFLIMYWGN